MRIMKESVLKNALVNLRSFFTMNVKRSINESVNATNEIKDLYNAKFHYLNVLNYYAFHKEEAAEYQKELELLFRVGDYCVFPYEPAKELGAIESGLDQESKMPYVIHNNHRLYFPSFFSVEKAVDMYRNYTLVEKLSNIEDVEGAPHQYQSSRMKVEKDDVLFDIGAAEGLFALDNIDKVSKVVLLEGDSKWLEALRKTFAPFSEKVRIIEKFVADMDTDTEVSLTTLLSYVDGSSSFVKMDIEGCEVSVINSARELLENTKDRFKFAVASYHRQHDYEDLNNLFTQMGYTTEGSSGYMLYHAYDTPTPPYFRKGIIRARKNVDK